MIVEYTTVSERIVEEDVQYIVHFNVHYRLLVERYARFKALYMGRKTLDSMAYFDIILVQIRAMFFESSDRKKNYTAQNVLRKIGNPELVLKLDDYLNSYFSDVERAISIQKAIKMVADKYICHYDNFYDKNHSLWNDELEIENQLLDQSAVHNFFSIVETLLAFVDEGLKGWHSEPAVISNKED